MRNPQDRNGRRDVIGMVLGAARRHLDMDVACVTRIEGDSHVVRYAEGDLASFGLAIGAHNDLDDFYCRYVFRSRQPNVIPDTSRPDVVGGLTMAGTNGVGAYIGVPLESGDGRLYGTLCCFSRGADNELGHRDVKFLRVLAEVVAEQIGDDERGDRELAVRRGAIERVLDGTDPVLPVFQPVVELSAGQVVGYEALSRFPSQPDRPVAEWFRDAAALGLGAQFEVAAMRAGLAEAARLPVDRYVAVNLSPASVSAPSFERELDGFGAGRVVVEITEHAAVDAYDQLRSAVARLRAEGSRLAVDDVGAGYATLKHILHLEPDVVKLDITLVRRLDLEPAKRALIASMVVFARELDAALVAEGVERESELAALRALGVPFAQGFLLGRPEPVTAF